MHDDQLVKRIANALRLYGRYHENAADTESGIRDWWLGDFEPRPSIEQVGRALDTLAAEGTFIRQPLDDGGHVWRPVSKS